MGDAVVADFEISEFLSGLCGLEVSLAEKLLVDFLIFCDIGIVAYKCLKIAGEPV